MGELHLIRRAQSAHRTPALVQHTPVLVRRCTIEWLELANGIEVVQRWARGGLHWQAAQFCTPRHMTEVRRLRLPRPWSVELQMALAR